MLKSASCYGSTLIAGVSFLERPHQYDRRQHQLGNAECQRIARSANVSTETALRPTARTPAHRLEYLCTLLFPAVPISDNVFSDITGMPARRRCLIQALLPSHA